MRLQGFEPIIIVLVACFGCDSRQPGNVQPATAANVPPPPSADQVTDWAAFSRPVHLQREEIPSQGSGDWSESGFWGKPIWIYGYSATSETRSSYVIGVYKAGDLFGENRAAMEQSVAEQIETEKSLNEKYPERNAPVTDQNSSIETRPDGRKVFFTVLGFGPGGAGVCAFTTVRQYDLMLYHVSGREDVPPEERMNDQAEPTRKLSDMFKDLEKHIALVDREMIRLLRENRNVQRFTLHTLDE